jgi:cell division protein FtsW (lipid II flippase)
MSVERTLSRLVNLFTTAAHRGGGLHAGDSATHFNQDAPLFRKQVVWTTIGIALMFLFVLVDYHALMEISPFLYGIGLALLGYVLVWGRLTRHVRSWIHIGGFQFQPSEFMKIFTALLIAKYFDSNDHAYLNLRNFIVVCAILGAPMLLIAIRRRSIGGRFFRWWASRCSSAGSSRGHRGFAGSACRSPGISETVPT